MLVFTVEKGDSPWPGNSGVFLQRPAGDQSMEEKVWWVWRWTLDDTALQQSNSGLKQKIVYYCTFLLPQASFKQQRLNVLYHNEGQFGVKHDFSTSCSRIVCIRRSRWVLDFKHTFPIPSNSMTSIRSPSTSWPTNWSPFCSKWCFSSGFTCNKIRFCDSRFYFLFCSCSTSRRKAMDPTKQNNVQIKSQS